MKARFKIPDLDGCPQSESALRWQLCLAADEAFDDVLRAEYGKQAGTVRYTPAVWSSRVRWRRAAYELAVLDYRAACEREGRTPYVIDVTQILQPAP